MSQGLYNKLTFWVWFPDILFYLLSNDGKSKARDLNSNGIEKLCASGCCLLEMLIVRSAVNDCPPFAFLLRVYVRCLDQLLTVSPAARNALQFYTWRLYETIVWLEGTWIFNRIPLGNQQSRTSYSNGRRRWTIGRYRRIIQQDLRYSKDNKLSL